MTGLRTEFKTVLPHLFQSPHKCSLKMSLWLHKVHTPNDSFKNKNSIQASLAEASCPDSQLPSSGTGEISVPSTFIQFVRVCQHHGGQASHGPAVRSFSCCCSEELCCRRWSKVPHFHDPPGAKRDELTSSDLSTLW